jgi:hypothetical protein
MERVTTGKMDGNRPSAVSGTRHGPGSESEAKPTRSHEAGFVDGPSGDEAGP